MHRASWLAPLCLAGMFAACDSHSPPAPPAPSPAVPTPSPVASPTPAKQVEASSPTVDKTPLFDEAPVSVINAVATWYDAPEGSLPKRRAPGEFTAAFDRLPLGTYARVINKATGRQVIVCITDRGVGKRSGIDLCKEAAEEIGLVGKGTAKVRIETLRARKDITRAERTRGGG